MLHAACDLFSAVGNQWLALVDRFSGYAWTTALRRLDTKAVIQHLESWFNDFGWPTHIRTDGGPHKLSSPYNPESNGLAEAAVKNLKSIVLRCTEKGENIQHAIAVWRNTSRQDGSSPAQLFFGRRQRLGLPLLPQHLEENHLQCTKKLRASTKTPKLLSFLTSDPKKGCGYSIIRQKTGTNNSRS